MADVFARALDDIAELLAQPKELIADRPIWERRARVGFDSLEFAVPLAIGGVIPHGLQARISCRSDMSDCDVHAQIQVWVPALAAYAHILRVEWRPNNPHTNPATAPASLRFKTFRDRWYDFGLNRRLGVPGLRQTCTMIAQPIPREIRSFNELLVFLQEVWKVTDISRVPSPPWEDRLV
jgi:hypothetical protein